MQTPTVHAASIHRKYESFFTKAMVEVQIPAACVAPTGKSNVDALPAMQRNDSSADSMSGANSVRVPSNVISSSHIQIDPE